MKFQSGIALGVAILCCGGGPAAGRVCEPQVVGEYPIGEFLYSGHTGVRHGDLYLIGVDGWNELRIYDIAEPGEPEFLSLLRGVRVNDVAVVGSLALVATPRQVVAVDITTLTAPRLLGALRLPGAAHAVVIDGGVAYVTGDHGLASVDFSDPAGMLALHSVRTPGTAGSIVMRDGVAFVGDAEEGLRIFDVSDPRSIREIGGLAGFNVFDMVGWRDTLIIQTAREGLLFVDVRDPAAPEVVARMATPSYAMDLALDGSTVWVTAGAAVWGSPELIAIDISKMPAPQEIGRATIQSKGGFGTLAKGLAPEAGRLYLMASHFDSSYYPVRVDFMVFDISQCASCYADCDDSGALDFFDFLCFQNLFAAGNPRADCDGSGELDVFDFLCFQSEFAAGCS